MLGRDGRGLILGAEDEAGFWRFMVEFRIQGLGLGFRL